MNKSITLSLISLLIYLPTAIAGSMNSPSPENAQVYFIAPQDGGIVDKKFTVKFGLSNMGVAPAGVDKKNTGHHHLLINKDLASVDVTKPLPGSDQLKHFGGGQTETQLELPPGKHTLQLLLGNHLHIPHNKPVVSEKITITVK